MKLYDGGALFVIIFALAMLGWSQTAAELEDKKSETCSVEVIETVETGNSFLWFGRGRR